MTKFFEEKKIMSEALMNITKAYVALHGVFDHNDNSHKDVKKVLRLLKESHDLLGLKVYEDIKEKK